MRQGPGVRGRGRGGRAGRALAAAALAAGVAAAPVSAAADTIAEHLEALRVQLPRELVTAPDFTLGGPEGRPVRLQDLRGKLVFLNFWATWCIPCRKEMPAMERLHRQYGGRGLSVVAVNSMETQAEVKAFVEELRLTFPTLLDVTGSVTQAFAVRALPVTFLVDRDGKILWKAIGSREWDGPHGGAYFRRLLEAKAP